MAKTINPVIRDKALPPKIGIVPYGFIIKKRVLNKPRYNSVF